MTMSALRELASLARQVLKHDKCFPQDERNALERSNEKQEAYPFTRVQSEGDC